MKLWPINKNVVATHTDSTDVFVWDFEIQENAQAKENASASIPDLM
jgi:hypothetical protein